MTIDEAELRGLLERATEGPWEAEKSGGKGSWIKGALGEWCALACGDTDESAEANAALIVAAVNSLPTLLDELSRLRRALETVLDETESPLLRAVARSALNRETDHGG